MEWNHVGLKVVGALFMLSGMLFQGLGAANAKAQRLSFNLALSTVRSIWSHDLND